MILKNRSFFESIWILTKFHSGATDRPTEYDLYHSEKLRFRLYFLKKKATFYLTDFHAINNPVAVAISLKSLDYCAILIITSSSYYK